MRLVTYTRHGNTLEEVGVWKEDGILPVNATGCDYDTMNDNTVTLRFRDSMEQDRVPVSELVATIKKATKDYKRV